MFFIFGLIMGAAAGMVAVIASGIPLLLGRGLGLLWGDRRLWWTLALLLGIFIAQFMMASSHRFKVQTDQLAKGFVGFQTVGVYVGALLCWGIGMLILQRWGAGWKPSLTGISWVISPVVVLVALTNCATMHQKPAKIREERVANHASWVKALQDRDLLQLTSLAKGRSADWTFLDEIQATPFQLAVREQDTALFGHLLSIHPKTRAVGHGIAGMVIDSGPSAMLKQYLDFFKGDSAVVEACLVAATYDGNRAVFDYLLNECEADANASANNRSALMMAVTKGRGEMAEELIRRGADVNAIVGVATPYTGETALQVAVHFKQEAMVKLLLARGAQVDLCHRGSLTPLMRAVKEDNLDICALASASGCESQREG